jgi:hypothetical protein
MPAVEPLLFLAVLCGMWAAISAVMIAHALHRRGLTTPAPFVGLFIFRNLRTYRAITLAETGRTGPLFYSYVVAINLAVVLVVLAWSLWTLA